MSEQREGIFNVYVQHAERHIDRHVKAGTTRLISRERVEQQILETLQDYHFPADTKISWIYAVSTINIHIHIRIHQSLYTAPPQVFPQIFLKTLRKLTFHTPGPRHPSLRNPLALRLRPKQSHTRTNPALRPRRVPVRIHHPTRDPAPARNARGCETDPQNQDSQEANEEEASLGSGSRSVG